MGDVPISSAGSYPAILLCEELAYTISVSRSIWPTMSLMLSVSLRSFSSFSLSLFPSPWLCSAVSMVEKRSWGLTGLST